MKTPVVVKKQAESSPKKVTIDQVEKDRLRCQLQKEAPFFLSKAQPVLTQDKNAHDAKNKSVAEQYRLRFERALLAERQKDLDHEN